MSATSEELAAQAEELQASISYFKTDAAGEGRRSVSARKLAAPARKMAPKPAKARSAVADQQARAKGFALDISTGGPDDDDADFREYGT
jgi:methyl-accepting chemotaxis protein